MPGPLLELEDFDWQALAEEAEAAAGDEGRALVENIARNVTESVRQPRNALEAAADAPKTEAEISDATDLELTEGHERNLRASFGTHMKALFRRTGEAMRQKIEAQTFMGFKPGEPATTLNLKEYSARNLANLGPHPHSAEAAIPIPKGYEAEAEVLSRISHLSPKVQARYIGRFLEAQAQGRAAPEIPR